MSTQIDNLSIRIESNSQSATAAIDGLVAALEKLKKAANLGGADKSVKKIAEAANKVKQNVPSAFDKSAKSVDKFSSSADKAKTSSDKLGDSLEQAAKSVLTLVGNVVGVNSLGDAIQKVVAQAVEWDGISARFGEGFGERADEAYAYVQKLSDALYINDQEFMKYSSNFATLAKGFGVAEDAVYGMSLGLTELGYDIWAKNNDFYSFEEALDAVRSAIVGEVEPIRRAGISITEATLKEVAASHGITKSVENMTEAEKALLRYTAMVEQAYSSGTVGTYAAELGTAEGQLRMLKQQTKSMAQALGSLFIPALNAVLPYISAFVNAVISAVQALAAFFGYRIKTPSWGSGLSATTKSANGTANALQAVARSADGVGAAAGGVSDTADALGAAGSAAKKLRDYTMGFDELNIINPPEESSGGGGGGGGGGAGGDLGLEIESLWDDAMLRNVQARVDEITAKFENLGGVIKVVSAALAALAVTGLLRSLGNALARLSTFQKMLASIAIVTLQFMIGKLTMDEYLSDEGTLKDLLANVITNAIGTYLLYRMWGTGGLILGIGITLASFITSVMFNSNEDTKVIGDIKTLIAGALTTAAAGIGATFAMSKLGFFKREGFIIGVAFSVAASLAAVNFASLKNGEIEVGSVQNVLLTLGSTVAAAIGGYVLTSAIFGASAGLVGLGIGLGLGILINVVASSIAMSAFERAKLWGKTELTAAEIKATAESLLDVDVEATIDLVDTTIANQQSAKDALNAAITTFNASLNKIQLRVDTSETALQVLQTDANTVLNSMIELINASNKTVEIGVELVPPKSAEGDDLAAGVLGASTGASSMLTQWAKAVGEDLSKWIADGMIDGLSDEEARMITELGNWLTRVSNALTSGKAAGKFEAEVKLLLSDLTEDSFKEVLKEYENLVEELKTANEEIAAENYATLVSQEAALTELEQYYIAVGDTVQAAEVRKKLDEIAKQIEEFDIAESVEIATEEAIDPARALFLESLQQIFGDALGEDLFNKKVNTDMFRGTFSAWLNRAVYQGTAELKTTGELADTIQQLLDESIKSATNNNETLIYAMDVLGFTGWDLLSSDVQQEFYDMLVEAFGQEKTDAILLEMGIDVSETLGEGIKTGIPEVESASKEAVDSMVASAESAVTDKEPSLFAQMKGFGVNLIDGMKSGMKGGKWATWISENVTSPITGTIEGTDWESPAKTAATALSKGLGSVNMPKFGFSWKSETKSINLLGKEISMQVPWPQISFMASGGFVDQGQLFVAREAGAEMVGSMGGRTAVANNDQIVEGISQGVYAAVRAAMQDSDSGSNAPVIVYLDGKQITASVEKRQRERGATIMTGGVNFGY